MPVLEILMVVAAVGLALLWAIGNADNPDVWRRAGYEVRRRER